MMWDNEWDWLGGGKGEEGGLWGGGKDWGSSYEVPGVCMVRCDALVSIFMEVSSHEFSWVHAYLACGCAISDDSHHWNVSGLIKVREFWRRNKYDGMKRIMNLMERASKTYSGRERYCPAKKVSFGMGCFRSFLLISSNRYKKGRGGYRYI